MPWRSLSKHWDLARRHLGRVAGFVPAARAVGLKSAPRTGRGDAGAGDAPVDPGGGRTGPHPARGGGGAPDGAHARGGVRPAARRARRTVATTPATPGQAGTAGEAGMTRETH